MKNQKGIEFIVVNNDGNGNPRYVCHFLNFITDNDREKLENGELTYLDMSYELALKRARKIGGLKFNNKQYRGGIVFQSYNITDTMNSIHELIKTGN